MIDKFFRILLKGILKLFTPLFIRDKKQRKDFIRHVSRSNFSVSSVFSFRRLMKADVSPKSVLMIEPNDFHGEVILGYADYFTRLGYFVDIVVTPRQMQSSPFALNGLKNVRFHAIDEIFFKRIISGKKDYDTVFFTSAFSSVHGPMTRYFTKETYPKAYGVLHDKTQLQDPNMKKLYDDKKLSVLRNFNRDPKLFEINPHYFGKIDPRPRGKKTNFITVGLLDPKKRNAGLVIDAARLLIQNGFKNFKVTVIARKKAEEKFPKDIVDYFDFKIGLEYDAMYHEMEKADYFLPLLDPTNAGQRMYLSTTSTGSIQLILAFLCPPLIDAEFAKAYEFTSKSAVIYKNNRLDRAMLSAMKLSMADYKKMQKDLSVLSIQKKSLGLSNLKKMIHPI